MSTFLLLQLVEKTLCSRALLSGSSVSRHHIEIYFDHIINLDSQNSTIIPEKKLFFLKEYMSSICLNIVKIGDSSLKEGARIKLCILLSGITEVISVKSCGCQSLCLYGTTRTLESSSSILLCLPEQWATWMSLAILVTEWLSEQFMSSGYWDKSLGCFLRNVMKDNFRLILHPNNTEVLTAAESHRGKKISAWASFPEADCWCRNQEVIFLGDVPASMSLGIRELFRYWGQLKLPVRWEDE